MVSAKTSWDDLRPHKCQDLCSETLNRGVTCNTNVKLSGDNKLSVAAAFSHSFLFGFQSQLEDASNATPTPAISSTLQEEELRGSAMPDSASGRTSSAVAARLQPATVRTTNAHKDGGSKARDS